MKASELIELINETSEEFVTACEDVGILDSVEFDVLVSAYTCDVEPQNIEELYQGKFDSDEEFVQDLLESIGYIPQLPFYVYIDWEKTAESVMQDYVTDSDHYFRIS